LRIKIERKIRNRDEKERSDEKLKRGAHRG